MRILAYELSCGAILCAACVHPTDRREDGAAAIDADNLHCFGVDPRCEECSRPIREMAPYRHTVADWEDAGYEVERDPLSLR